MAHKALDVAHLILEKDPGDRPMTHLRLLKLTYMAHGLFLGKYHRRLIQENAEAWMHGPVIYPIYYHFQDHSGDKIIPTGDKTPPYQWSDGSKEKLEEDAGTFIGQVVDTYAHQTGQEMNALTHQIETPWYKTVWPYAKAGYHTLPPHLVIPADYIEKYYSKLFKRHEKAMGR